MDPLLKSTYRQLPRLPRYTTCYLVLSFLIFFILLEWQIMPLLGGLIVRMVVLNFPTSSICTKILMLRKSSSFFDQMISMLIGVQVLEDSGDFRLQQVWKRWELVSY